MENGWFEAATEQSAVGREARAVAWEATPLGPPSGWPVALRHAVRLCYSTRFPVMLVWGPDLTLIYNDGYRDMLGTDKHPAALGAPARTVWREIWDDIGPLFEQVLTTGRPTWSRDMPLLMNRSGFDEETYFTFSYSALLDDDGQIAGLLDIATETTQEVLNQRRLLALGEVQAALSATFTDLRAFAEPVVEALARSADLTRTAIYDASGTEILVEAGIARDAGETELVRRAAASGQRQSADGVLVKPVRAGDARGVLAVVVLRATSLRPWDEDAARFLSVLAATVAAALRDAVRLRSRNDALRRRAVQSEAQTARATEVSLALQQAVLTEPPRLDHLEVAVHYQPAALERDIGGDWYDVFATRDGATTLVIGDVVGHDLGAAVAMGQLRALVRAIGYDSQESPARVLERVDTAIEGLALGSAATATVLVARIEQDDEQRPRGARTVRWSSAGHLPPVLVRADGTSEALRVRNGLLLGMDPTTLRSDHTVEILPGDTLVLYTDGLVERRDSSLRDRLDELVSALTATHGVDLDTMVESILERLLDDAGEDDDVALVVVRALAQDSPSATEVTGATHLVDA